MLCRLGSFFGSSKTTGDAAEVPYWVLTADSVRPTLDLDYANNRVYVRGLGSPSIASIHDVVGANGTTFTGGLQVAAGDVVNITSAAVSAAGVSLAQGTLVVHFTDLLGPVAADHHLVMLRRDASNRTFIRRNAANKLKSSVVNATVFVADFNSTNNMAAATPYRAALAYATDNLGAAYTASLQTDPLGPDTSGTPPSGAFTFYVGGDNTASSGAFVIHRLAWFQQRLSQTALDALRAA